MLLFLFWYSYVFIYRATERGLRENCGLVGREVGGIWFKHATNMKPVLFPPLIIFAEFYFFLYYFQVFISYIISVRGDSLICEPPTALKCLSNLPTNPRSTINKIVMWKSCHERCFVSRTHSLLHMRAHARTHKMCFPDGPPLGFSVPLFQFPACTRRVWCNVWFVLTETTCNIIFTYFKMLILMQRKRHVPL